MKTKEHTIVLPADTEADLKAVAECEVALGRQLGWQPKLELHKDDKGKTWAIAGWPMRRQDQAVIRMFQRRGSKPVDDKGKKTKALLAAKDVKVKSIRQVKDEQKLTKEK